MISSSPVTWTMRHVPGHQDGDSSVKLDWWATQNIQMDNLAKVFWMQHSHLAPVFYPISDEGFQVWLSNRKLSCHNTPPVSAEWETCSSSGKNSRPWTALAAESTRMLVMYGLARNLQSSLSGRCLCQLSANGSSQFTPPKKSHIGSSSASPNGKAPSLSLTRTPTCPAFSRPLTPRTVSVGWLSLKDALLLNGPVFKKLTSFGSVDAIPASDGPPLSLSNCWKLLGIFGITVTKHLEMAQDIACRNAIMLAVRSEYAFGRSGLPRRDWRLFKRPLLSTLSSSLHYMDTRLLRVQTAPSRKVRRDANALNPAVTTVEDNLPSMNGPRHILQQFQNPAAPP